MALLPRAFPIFPKLISTAWSAVDISFATSRAHLIWIMPFEMATSMTREQGGPRTSIVRSWSCLTHVRNHCTPEEEQEGETVAYRRWMWVCYINCTCTNHSHIPGRRKLQCPKEMPESPAELKSRLKNGLNF